MPGECDPRRTAENGLAGDDDNQQFAVRAGGGNRGGRTVKSPEITLRFVSSDRTPHCQNRTDANSFGPTVCDARNHDSPNCDPAQEWVEFWLRHRPVLNAWR